MKQENDWKKEREELLSNMKSQLDSAQFQIVDLLNQNNRILQQQQNELSNLSQRIQQLENTNTDLIQENSVLKQQLKISNN